MNIIFFLDFSSTVCHTIGMNNKYFGTFSFYKRALLIAVPVMAQLLIQNLVSLVDNFMVAGLGDIKMSGVNIAGSINFIFLIFTNTICMAGGIFMSQFKGANDSENMQQTFRFKLLFLGFFGIAYSLLCYIAPRALFSVMVTINKDASAILDQAQVYSRAVAFSWIFMVLSQACASSLREIERVRSPLIISITATLINTIFNWLLIYGHLGFPRLEVRGAGYATVIAQVSQLAIFIVYLAIRRPDFIFNIFKLFSIKITLFISIAKKSVVLLYAELFWAFAEAFSNALYNTRGGAEVVSGMAAGFAIANLFFVCFSGIVNCTGIIMGQELGAGHLEEAKKQKNWILTGSVIFACGFTLIGFSTVLLIPFVFKNLTPEARIIARNLILIAALYLPLWALINAQYSISRTGGDTKMGAVCDTVGNVLFILGMILTTAFTKLGPATMFAIVKLSDVPKSLIAHFWLKKEKWLVNLAEKNR